MTASLLAAFTGPDAMVDAAKDAAGRGWRPLDAFTPFPVKALDEPLALPRPILPWIMLAGGVLAGAGLYGLQWFSATQAYAFDVGGRPDDSWPTFILAAAEVSILGAAIAGFVALLVGARLPRLNHPLFDRVAFERASQDQFVLALPVLEGEAAAELRALLFDCGAVWVEEAEL